MLPKISVITASYNSAEFIERTIISVLSQNYPNLEYIIIDGGSTDGTVDIIKKYEDRLAYWYSESDNGQYDAINKGFKKATGDILAFLNADDIYLPWTLTTVAAIFSTSKEIEWVTSLNTSTVDSDGAVFRSGIIRPISTRGFREGLYIPGCGEFGCIVQEGTFWRKVLWEKVGSTIDLNYKLAGDFDLWARFTDHTSLYCLGQPLAAMTRHGGQRSNALAEYQSECLKSLKGLHASDAAWKPNTKLIQSRNNRLVWSFARRFIDYKSLIVESEFDEQTLKTRWRTKEIQIY